MDRHSLLQKIIDKNNFKHYLEIGTFRGSSLLPLKCKNKIAIDPFFKIPRQEKIKWKFKNFSNVNNKYYEMTSDEFFNSKKLLGKHAPFQLVFVDGLHTFKASLIDVLNSISCLSENGFIVMHDCLPPHKPAATPANSAYDARMKNFGEWPGDWCGDVWKTIVYLKENYKDDMDVFVLDVDFGLGVLRVKNKNLDLGLNQELYNKIDQLNYEYLISDTLNILNLKEYSFIEKFLSENALITPSERL